MAVFSLVGKKVLKKFIYNKSKVWIYFIAPSFQSPGWKIRSPGVLIAFKFVIFLYIHFLYKPETKVWFAFLFGHVFLMVESATFFFSSKKYSSLQNL